MRNMQTTEELTRKKTIDKFDNSLIGAVKRHPCLYNKKCINYKNQFEKSDTWKEISSELGQGENICRLRWRSLRDRYVREQARIKRATQKGISKIKKWSMFNSLNFLKDHVGPRRRFNVKFDVERKKDTTITDEECEDTIPAIIDYSLSSDNEGSISFLDIDDSIEPSESADMEIPSTNNSTTSSDPFAENLCTFLSTLDTVIRKRFTIENKHDGFFRMIKGYLDQMSDTEQDSIKIEVLNFIYNKISERSKPYKIEL